MGKISKNTMRFMDCEEYDPIQLITEQPALVATAVEDYPDKVDELVIICIDKAGNRHLDTLPEAVLQRDAIDRRIQRLKLTTS